MLVFGMLPKALLTLASPVCVPYLHVCFVIGVSCVLLPSRCLFANTPAFSSCTCLPCRIILWTRTLALSEESLNCCQKNPLSCSADKTSVERLL